MSNQTKIGLLLGLGVILLVGIIVSDHLATQSQNHIQDAGPVLTSLGEAPGTNQNERMRAEFLGRAPVSMSETISGNPATANTQFPPVMISMQPDTAPIAMTQPQNPGLQPAQVPGQLVTAPQPAVRTYTVKQGDLLSTIAAETLGSRNRWPELVSANKAMFDRDTKLRIGSTLVIPQTQAVAAVKLPPVAEATLPVQPTQPVVTTPPQPAPAATRTYTVAKGDLLGSIAQKTLGSTARVKDLVAANKKVLPKGDKTVLQTGMTLVIPAK